MGDGARCFIAPSGEGFRRLDSASAFRYSNFSAKVGGRFRREELEARDCDNTLADELDIGGKAGEEPWRDGNRSREDCIESEFISTTSDPESSRESVDAMCFEGFHLPEESG